MELMCSLLRCVASCDHIETFFSPIQSRLRIVNGKKTCSEFISQNASLMKRPLNSQSREKRNVRERLKIMMICSTLKGARANLNRLIAFRLLIF